MTPAQTKTGSRFSSGAARRFDKNVLDLAKQHIEFSWLQINEADGTDADDPAYGCHDIRKKRHSTEDHWADKMNWWLRPGEIGFISSKGDGGARQYFTYISEKYNAEWFGKPY